MKNITLIFAGGSGSRMNTVAKPKQFLSLNGKDIIIHTIEQFENHYEIDEIVVVCIAEWIDYMNSLLEKFNIQKVKCVVLGGETGQQSIFKGLQAIKETCTDDSIILVHDGVRPLIDADLISRNIATAKKYGTAITVSPAIETIVNLCDQNKIQKITDRSKCFYAKAPQTFKFKNFWDAHNRAISEGIFNIIDSASLMNYYGYELHTVECSHENIKITNPSDFYMFRALYEAKENSQIFGI